jgi:serine/threonine-protein kinase
VKLLDFGLAKAAEPAATSSPSLSMSPTLSMHATQAGIILGTAAYMSPEQARGKMNMYLSGNGAPPHSAHASSAS